MGVSKCPRALQRLLMHCLLAVALLTTILSFKSTAWAADDQVPLQRNGRSKQWNVAQERVLTHREDYNEEPIEAPPRSENSADFRQQWETANYHIKALVDDEYRLESLLAPFTDAGESLLRDLTFRVRAYGKTFKIWEELHHSSSNDESRQLSVVTRLRSIEHKPPLSVAEAIRNYDKLRAFINVFSKRLFPWTMLSHPDHMSLHASFRKAGRGIVLTAGNNQADQLLIMIPSLRKLGCQLPIEIMYLGDDDLEEERREELEQLDGVVTRDLKLMIDDDGWRLAGWAVKPFALLMSSFREAIFIDADSFFFVNPATLFDNEDYRATGALFFKDRNVSPESKRIWIRSILPAPISAKVKQNRLWTGESGHHQESGVLVVDKYRRFLPLLVATRLNGPDRDGDADGKRGAYDMVYGDKETFWLSWEMADDLDYAFHGGVAGTMGKLTTVYPSDEDSEDMPEEVDGPMICSPQLVHFDLAGKPIWFNGWISATKDDLYKWQDFDYCLMEQPELGKKPSIESWKIHGCNVVCLKGTEAKKFGAHGKSTLEGILSLAKSKHAIS